MSSRSGTPLPSDALVVGGWKALPLALALAERGCATTLVSLPSRGDELGGVPVFVGNGECWENARLIFGERLATKVWKLSRDNFERVSASGCGRAGRLLWLAKDAAEVAKLEPSARAGGRYLTSGDALVAGPRRFLGALEERYQWLDLEALREKVVSAGVKVVKATGIDAVETSAPLTARVRGKQGKSAVTWEASVVVVASDELPPALLPSVADKWVQVTLTWMRNRTAAAVPAEAVLFHLGADFGFADGAACLRLGSFRNLFEDRAVGLHDTPDPVTVANVRRFFGELGWIDLAKPSEAGVLVESLGCDGLPVVGALPDLPTVFFVAGFSGRAGNFLFSVADALAEGIVRDKGFASLDIFSTKRFT